MTSHESIHLNNLSNTLEIQASVNNGATGNIQWVTSSQNIFTVNNGVITPVNHGTANLTVSVLGTGVSKVIPVTISVPITSITTNVESLVFNQYQATQSIDIFK